MAEAAPFVLVQIPFWVDVDTVDNDADMQMISGYIAGSTNLGNGVVLVHRIANLRQKLAAMGIERTIPTAMIDDQIISVADMIPRFDDCASLHRKNRRAVGIGNVQTIVVGGILAGNTDILAFAKERSDVLLPVWVIERIAEPAAGGRRIIINKRIVDTQQRKLTHDFRAHLDTLSAMLVQQPFDIDAIKSYVRSLQSAQTSLILLVNTHHSTLDALLNQKALVARNRSIDVQFRVNDLSAVKIDLVDLTVIISNTLDNAIEACEKLPVQERQIYVQVVLNDNELFYAVRNRSLPIDVSSDRLPVTTKENPSFHGYGLQNVQTTLAKYHSVYAMDYADGWFEFATDLPNTLIS